MKEQFYRFLAIICLIGVIGTTNGYEWSMFGVGRWLMQTALFMAGMVLCHKAAETARRKRRRNKRVIN